MEGFFFTAKKNPKPEKNLLISSEKFAVIKPSGGNHVSFIRCFGAAICRLYRRQGQDPAGSAGRQARTGRKGLVRDRCPHRREIPRGAIYGPSYLSFDYALSVHALIPEAVYNAYTSATFQKGKTKRYENAFGTFLYRDVPAAVYPLGVEIRVEGGYSYQIASPEKALCDKLYSLSPVYSVRALKELLFDDLRIDEAAFFALQKDDILQLAPLYRATNLKLLAKFMEGK